MVCKRRNWGEINGWDFWFFTFHFQLLDGQGVRMFDQNTTIWKILTSTVFSVRGKRYINCLEVYWSNKKWDYPHSFGVGRIYCNAQIYSECDRILLLVPYKDILFPYLVMQFSLRNLFLNVEIIDNNNHLWDWKAPTATLEDISHTFAFRYNR